jgi:4'-phosphopantetheinyl transferase
MVAVDAPIRTWVPGPPTVRATASAIDVWRADLEADPTATGERPEQLLSDEELARAARILSARKRVLWARSRGVLRALLGRYLDRDPRSLRFELGPHGKPALAPVEDAPTTDLRFNLSHSSTLALYAVTVGRAVGIDVEAPHRGVDELAVAARVLGREQARRLAELDPPSRTREFLRAWVAHEAAVKCLGLGLAAPPEGNPLDGLWTTQLDVGPAAAAAVSVEGGPCELRHWNWQD